MRKICIGLLLVGLLGMGCARTESNKGQAAAAAEKAKKQASGAAKAAVATTAKAEEAGAAKAGEKMSSKAGPALMSAVYEVPGLDADTVKKLTTALADKAGLVSAKPDLDAGTFTVTFESGKVCPNALLGILRSVKADINLKSTTAASGHPTGHDCGGCPHNKKCEHGH